MFIKNSIAFCLVLVLSLLGCAKRGNITGGLKDSLAPILIASYPKNFTTNFTGNEISLTFDEYIKLKDANKQLVVSPPMKYEPVITPTNASKYLNIRIKDTLLPNTTYSFNFGQSITDNNEGNPLNQFKYVFSTGTYIDSLSLGGTIKDALEKESDSFVSVMLYDQNDKFKDSIVYTDMPRYITNTLDSLKTFRLENLKAGKYLLVALKDNNKNNKFNSKEEKIGFLKQAISIPNDTLFELELFKEVIPFKAFKPTQASSNKLYLGYDGTQDFKLSKPKVVLTKEGVVLPTIVTQMPKKDSLQIWYKPLKNDSLVIAISRDKYEQKYSFKVKDQKTKDTLTVSALQTGTIGYRERFTLETGTPLVTIDKSKFSFVNGAKETVEFQTEHDAFNQKLYIDFKKVPAEKYNLTLLPGALVDFFDTKSDTLSYKFATKELDQVGNLKIKLQNVKKYPIIVQLTNQAGEVKETEYSTGGDLVEFKLIDPSVYTLRIIYDDNKNQQYDSGNYLAKRYAEEVVYFSKDIDVRVNWDVEQTFDVSLPYVPEPKKKPAKKGEGGNGPR
ncbi:hypothetical protein FFWV33_05825 [Flavobacterium faecale]|uniref:SbsA Ig-like domain-containing protein n=1 Tax=Flavobacterium faecale TaxID=1355330 RepID=A0A2S1LBJ2_9FLAO|nr:Ig-like domain-containing protein [Flavobacterium faecale]AWG21084.1 hypothetical protein FFWV33_05825 [Flavobacterium faecale]